MPFAIAGGGMDTARAVIVRVELDDGTIGLGESAPFPAVSGETVESTLAALRRHGDGGPGRAGRARRRPAAVSSRPCSTPGCVRPDGRSSTGCRRP